MAPTVRAAIVSLLVKAEAELYRDLIEDLRAKANSWREEECAARAAHDEPKQIKAHSFVIAYETLLMDLTLRASASQSAAESA